MLTPSFIDDLKNTVHEHFGNRFSPKVRGDSNIGQVGFGLVYEKAGISCYLGISLCNQIDFARARFGLSEGILWPGVREDQSLKLSHLAQV
jgi:hypothetical protein